MSVTQRKIGGRTFAVYTAVANHMDDLAARLAEAERLLREWVADAYCDPRANLPDLVNRTRHAIGAVRATDSADEVKP